MDNLKPYTDCNGNCSRCGNCCTIAIPITRDEEKEIRQYIKKNDIKPENLYEGNNFYACCCFYDRKNHKCKIYDVRPSICRSFQCNRNIEELEKEKIINHYRAFWNHMDLEGNLSNFTTFDLLFYNNPKPIMNLIFNSIDGEITEEKYKEIIEKMKQWGLEELANHLVPTFDE